MRRNSDQKTRESSADKKLSARLDARQKRTEVPDVTCVRIVTAAHKRDKKTALVGFPTRLPQPI